MADVWFAVNKSLQRKRVQRLNTFARNVTHSSVLVHVLTDTTPTPLCSPASDLLYTLLMCSDVLC